MKHVKLFEAFMDSERMSSEKIFYGLLNDGGIGAHPFVATEQQLRMLKAKGMDAFDVKEATLGNPEVLVYYQDFEKYNGMPEIIEVSHSQAAFSTREELDFQMGKTFLSYESGSSDAFMEMEKTFGLSPENPEGPRSISIIPNPKVGYVYWSDTPEAEKTYWEAPYQEIPLESMGSSDSMDY